MLIQEFVVYVSDQFSNRSALTQSCLLNILIIKVLIYQKIQNSPAPCLWTGESVNRPSEIYGVPHTTINDIMKNGDRIEEFMCKTRAVEGLSLIHI